MSSEQAKAKPAQFGMIGLGVMGRNLALNIEEHGFPVAVWNLETDWVDSFINENPAKQFTGTRRREADLRAAGLNFIGSGVSGGEVGARFGPSLMPGGARQAYEHIRPVFEAIAAKTDSGACVTYVGPDGAGHFVKMVHNGIEYGDMQLIAEAYDILRHALSATADQLAEIFAEWNRRQLASYLIE